MKAIYKKEINQYFNTSMGYIFIGAYLVVAGIMFSLMTITAQSTDMTYYFSNMSMFTLIIIPILTMKTFSDEKRQKTDQLLYTAPIKLTDIVLGKYFAALSVFAFAMAITVAFPLIMSFFGPLPTEKIFGSYIGSFLISACFIAIGMFISSLCESQVISAIATFAVLLLLRLTDTFANVIPVDFISRAFEFVALFNKYPDFYLGILDISNVVYYVSYASFFVFLTVMVTQRRRWI